MYDVLINRSGNFFTLQINHNLKNYDVIKDTIMSASLGHIVQYQMDPNLRFSKPQRISIPLQFCIRKNKIDNKTGKTIEYFVYFIGIHKKIINCLNKNNIPYLFKNTESKQKNDALVTNDAVLEQFEFRDKQLDIIKLIQSNDCGQIVCPTGFGKSFIISVLAKLFPKAKILITTHINSVLQQHYLALSESMGDVGIICAKKKHNTKARVMCVGTKSLNNIDTDFDFVFADEMHELGTIANYKLLTRFPYAKMFGFSANDKRPDGGQCIMQAIFGSVLIEVDYQDAVKHNAVVQLEVRFIPVNMQFNPCLGLEKSVARERHGIWNNIYRNKIIAKIAELHKDEQVLITCKTMEHAFRLKRLLPDYTVIYGSVGRFNSLKKIGIIDKNEKVLTTDDQLRIKQQFSSGELKKVIATSVWNRGVDFKPLQVLIRADGSNSNIADKQIPGRASRVCEGKEKGYIYDFSDEFDSGFAQKSKQRRKRYLSEGWKVIDADNIFEL